jgi:Arm DNA-binding domain
MAIHKLTAARIAKLNKDGMYGDGGGLWLQIKNGGAAKSWLFRWTEPKVGGVRGRDRVIGLGPLHTVDIDEARDLAKAQRKLLMQGLDRLSITQRCRTGIFPASCTRCERTPTRVVGVCFKRVHTGVIQTSRCCWNTSS